MSRVRRRERMFLFRHKFGVKCTVTHHAMILTRSRTRRHSICNTFFPCNKWGARAQRHLYSMLAVRNCSCCLPLWVARGDCPRRSGGVGCGFRLGPLAGYCCTCCGGGGRDGWIRRQGPRLQVPGRQDPARRWRWGLLLLLLGAQAEPQFQLVVLLLLLPLASRVFLHLLRRRCSSWRRLAGDERHRGARSSPHLAALLLCVGTGACVLGDTSRERKGGEVSSGYACRAVSEAFASCDTDLWASSAGIGTNC